jgi:hypothetical protein
MARMKFVCPAAMPIAGATPACGGCLCRIETSQAGLRGEALEASIISPATSPATLNAWCTDDYSTCPSWRADQNNRRALALAEQE